MADGRYRNLQIDFYDPDLNFLSGGSTRQLLSVQASSLLSGVGTFSCSYPWPLNVSPAFGTLEKIGNIVSFSYEDFNSGVGQPGRMRTLGEAYLIETLEASNTNEGQIIRLTGRSLISELERVLAWEPIGELHTFNTTLKIAVVGKFYKSLAAPALQGDDKITLNSTADVGETDMLEIPLTSGGMAYVIVSSVEGSVVTLTGGMPGAASNGASVGVLTRKITPNSVEGMNKGSKLTLTLDSGSYTTIIQEGPQEESGGGDQYVILRDPVPGNAAIGKAIVVQDRSEPAQDDIEQIMAQAPEWTQAALGLTWYGSAHNPEGQPVLDLLQTVSGMRNLPFRLALLPTTNLPTRELVWGTHESGSTPGYTLAIGNPPAATALNYRQQNFGIAAGGISNEESGPIYSRVYPTSGDESVSLYGVSANMTPILDPYVLVNDPATLGLYARPYIKNPTLEATGYIASKTESFSHITSETAGMDAYMTASDMLALEAMTWLGQHSGGGYNWKLRDVTITSNVQQFPGQRVDIHYYDSSSQVRPSHTYHLREDLIITEMSWTWDSESNRPRLDMTLNSRAIVSNSNTRMAQKLRTYDRTVARVASGGIEGRSVIVKTVTPSGPPPVTGSYLPLAGGHMTGNITLDASRTVDGIDISAHAANASAHHTPVTLSNTGLSLSGQAIGLLLDSNPGLVIGGSGVKINLATNAGLLLSGNQLLMGTPTTLSATSANNVSGTTHTHQISHTNDAVTFANNIMSTGISGEMSVKRIGVGATSVSTAIALFQNISTSQHTIQVKQISGQTGDLWRIENTSGGALIRLTGGGDLESGQPGFVSGLTGWQITHDGNAEFNNAFIRGELHATTFVADEMHATGGTIAVMTVAKVAPPANVNDNKMGGIGSTFVLNLEDSWYLGIAYVTAGDVLRLKPMGQLSSGGSLSLYDIYLEVVSAGSQVGRNINPDNGDVSPGYRPTTVRRLRGGANNLVIPQATAAVKWGKIGSSGFTGGLVLTSDLSGAPYIDVFTVDATKSSGQWQSTNPDTFITPRVRVGNLIGVLGKSVDEWGIAMATDLSDTEVSSRSLTVSNAGIVLRNADLRAYSGSATRISFSSTGNVKLGTNVEFGEYTTFDFEASTGHTRLGPYAPGLPHMVWDNVNGTLRIRNYQTDVIRFDSGGDSYFAGVMTIGSLGEIRQGTGTPGTTGSWPGAGGSAWGTFTGLRIGRSSSVGRLAVYNNGEYQFFTDTSGALYAGAGKMKVASDGVTLESYAAPSGDIYNVYNAPNALKFRTSGGEYTGHIASLTNGAKRSISIVPGGSSATQGILVSTSEITLNTTGSIYLGVGYNGGASEIAVYGNVKQYSGTAELNFTGKTLNPLKVSAAWEIESAQAVWAGTFVKANTGFTVGASVASTPQTATIVMDGRGSAPTAPIGTEVTFYVIESGGTYTFRMMKPGGSSVTIASV
jgi:hypothetical protein